jgi:hypothetical protein
MLALEVAGTFITLPGDTHFGLHMTRGQSSGDLMIGTFETLIHKSENPQEAASRLITDLTDTEYLAVAYWGSFAVAAVNEEDTPCKTIYAFSAGLRPDELNVNVGATLIVSQDINLAALPLTPGTQRILEAYRRRGQKK